MPLKPPEISESLNQALERDIDVFLRGEDPSPRDRDTKRSWQEVHLLTLEDLRKAEFNRKPKGWRCLMSKGLDQGFYATFDETQKMTGLSRGPEASVALQADKNLRSLPQAAIGESEWHVLAIPGLLTEAFWLKSGSEEWVVPFFTSQELRCGYAYPLKDFLAIAAAMAKKQVDRLNALRSEEEKKKRLETLGNRSKERRNDAEQRLKNEAEKRLKEEEKRMIAERIQKARG